MQVEPFKIAIPDDDLDDLRRRLRLTRWPEPVVEGEWQDGTDAGYLRALLDHWDRGFDWRSQEARLNRLPQFRARVGGLAVHFVHRRGEGPAPLPIILTHGWPGSFLEMEQLIPMLADPAAFGGDPRDAFHVIVPSLPGFGFSDRPLPPGLGTFEVAALWSELMKGLGYERYAVQGGDLGAGVSTWLAYRHPSQVAGLHLNYIPGSYRPPLGEGQPPVSDEERAHLDRQAGWADLHGGYAHVQSTQPQSLAFGLNDSPAGLAAWFIDKFRAWSDCGGDVETAFRRDDLLTNICLYWLTGTVRSSMQMYKAGRARPMSFAPGERVVPPLGFAAFPHEISHPPRSWIERVYDVRRWTVMPRGGHFAAMEAPDLLAEDLRAFFRPLRV